MADIVMGMNPVANAQSLYTGNDWRGNQQNRLWSALGLVSMGLNGEINAVNEGVTVVGEGMKRVSMEAAKHSKAVILNDMPKFTGTAEQITSQMMAYNRKWLLQQMRSGRTIVDIGLDPARGVPSIFYQMEQNMMKNYLKLHPNAFQIIK
jgi:hypothetical protein